MDASAVTHAGEATGEGLRVAASKGKGVEVSASGHALDVFQHTVEFTLTWMGGHPVLTVILLLFLLATLLIWRSAMLDKARMKLEYRAKREAQKGRGVQTRLPLPTGEEARTTEVKDDA